MSIKKISIIFVVFLISTVFFSSNNRLPSVNADIENFTLKDGFETYIENKIYTEQENLTIPEYFTYDFGDSCDFTEDTEDFVYSSSQYFQDYSVSQSDGNLIIEGKRNTIGATGFLKYIKQNIGISLIHYNVLEIKAKINYTEYGSPNLVVQDQNNFPFSSNLILSTEFQVFTEVIDINSNFYENKTSIILRLAVSPIPQVYSYKLSIDYIKFWRNNITDYATSLDEDIKDSWDFSEGDTDGFISVGASHSVTILDGTFILVTLIDTGFIKEKIQLDLNSEYYYTFVLRVFSNRTNPSFLLQIYDQSFSFGGSNFFSQNEWTTIKIDLSFYDEWIDDCGICFRFNTDYAWEMYKVDYCLITHNNLEDKVFYQSQNTSYYRASNGLYSFYHNISKNYTFYDDFTVNLNSCVIIDIPSIFTFPQKIGFMIYSNSYFNVSLFIGTQEFILYEKTNTNSWLYIGRTINRQNYLINETEIEIYFKIYTENQFIQNYLEYYIDNLEIRYTETLEIFRYKYDTNTGTNLDYFNINATGNYFKAEPSGINDFAINEDTMGLNYNSSSNTIFSRRVFYHYVIENTDSRVMTYIYQYSTFKIDREYIIISEISVTHNISYPIGIYTNSQIELKNRLFVDGIDQNINSSRTINDYFFEGFFNFDYKVNIMQVDYDTISVGTSYSNRLTGNMTSSEPFAFDINKADTKTSLNFLQVHSEIRFRPYLVLLMFFQSNPVIVTKISRDVTHSREEAEDIVDVYLPDYPEWDDDHPFLSFFAFCLWFPQVVIRAVLEMFQIGFTMENIFDILEDLGIIIPDMFNDMYKMVENIFIDIGNILTTLLSSEGLLGGILTGIGAIISGITNLITSVGNIWDWLSNFFDNIIAPFGDFWDGFLGDFSFIGGNWGDLMSGFTAGNWGNMPNLWGDMFPAMNIDFINSWKGVFSGFYVDFFGWDFVSLIDVVKDFFSLIGMVITILIVIYLIHLFKLAGGRDWDRLRLEISGIIGVLVWIVSAIAKIIHWIFEVIWALLDVLIPFT